VLEARCADLRKQIESMERAAHQADVEQDRRLLAQIELLGNLTSDLSKRFAIPATEGIFRRVTRRLTAMVGLRSAEKKEIERTTEELRRLAQALIASVSR